MYLDLLIAPDADWKTRPIMGLVGGLHAPAGRIMGHAGAWTAVGEPGAHAKYQALERAGAVMVNHPEKFGEGMKTLLNSRPRVQNTTVISQYILCKPRH